MYEERISKRSLFMQTTQENCQVQFGQRRRFLCRTTDKYLHTPVGKPRELFVPSGERQRGDLRRRPLTFMPSIRKPSVVVELMVSLHCM